MSIGPELPRYVYLVEDSRGRLLGMYRYSYKATEVMKSGLFGPIEELSLRQIPYMGFPVHKWEE